MNISILSSPFNIFKSLLKPSHNIESVLSSSIFLSSKSVVFSPFYPTSTVFKICFKNKKITRRCGQNARRSFCLIKKKVSVFWTTETIIFIRIIARASIQRNQPYLWFIAYNDRNMLGGHNVDSYFLNFSWNIRRYHLHSTTSTTNS